MKTLTRNLLLVVTSLALVASASAQLTLSDYNTNTITFAGFTGAGFAPTPGAGQLDSDTWKVTGLSDGDLVFGGTGTTGDYARGRNPGTTVTQGGVYAWTNSQFGVDNPVLGVQPTDDDFTPGSFVLRLQNTSGAVITALYVTYDIWVRNDEDRGNSFNFSHSGNDSSYTAVSSLDFTSPAAKDASPAWSRTTKTTTITGLSIADNSYYYLRWSGADVSGTGSRDVFGLDNVGVAAIPEPSVGGGGTGGVVGVAAAPVTGRASSRFPVAGRSCYTARPWGIPLRLPRLRPN